MEKSSFFKNFFKIILIDIYIICVFATMYFGKQLYSCMDIRILEIS